MTTISLDLRWRLCVLCCCLCVLGTIQASMFSLRGIIRAPIVIPAKDTELHKYCAVVAATEPYKEVCVEQIRNFISPLQYWTRRLIGGKTDFEQADAIRDVDPCVHFALERYEHSVRDAVKAYGLSIEDFNRLSQQLQQEKNLKRMIALQTFLYRIAGDLDGNLKGSPPNIPIISMSKKVTTSPKKTTLPYDVDTDDLSKFDQQVNQWYSDTTPEQTRLAAALINIENDRINIRERLKRELHVNDLPPKMADPEYLPVMCKQIQRACREFPSIAASHIARCGFHLEEFNALQQKVKKDPFYRTYLRVEINRLQREKKKALGLSPKREDEEDGLDLEGELQDKR